MAVAVALRRRRARSPRRSPRGRLYATRHSGGPCHGLTPRARPPRSFLSLAAERALSPRRGWCAPGRVGVRAAPQPSPPSCGVRRKSAGAAAPRRQIMNFVYLFSFALVKFDTRVLLGWRTLPTRGAPALRYFTPIAERPVALRHSPPVLETSVRPPSTTNSTRVHIPQQ